MKRYRITDNITEGKGWVLVDDHGVIIETGGRHLAIWLGSRWDFIRQNIQSQRTFSFSEGPPLVPVDTTKQTAITTPQPSDLDLAF
jgi:hypothetical protein